MRHPVDRLVSTYHFIQRRYPVYQAYPGAVMNRRVVEEKWSLEKFLFHRYYRNCYSKFFWCFSLQRFAFIGIVEHYEEELAFLSERILGSSLPVYQENTNPEKRDSHYGTEPALRRRLEQFHAKDMELYQLALALRHQRMQRVELAA